jgi:hypothetical protein
MLSEVGTACTMVLLQIYSHISDRLYAWNQSPYHTDADHDAYTRLRELMESSPCESADDASTPSEDVPSAACDDDTTSTSSKTSSVGSPRRSIFHEHCKWQERFRSLQPPYARYIYLCTKRNELHEKLAAHQELAKSAAHKPCETPFDELQKDADNVQYTKQRNVLQQALADLDAGNEKLLKNLSNRGPKLEKWEKQIAAEWRVVLKTDILLYRGVPLSRAVLCTFEWLCQHDVLSRYASYLDLVHAVLTYVRPYLMQLTIGHCVYATWTQTGHAYGMYFLIALYSYALHRWQAPLRQMGIRTDLALGGWMVYYFTGSLRGMIQWLTCMQCTMLGLVFYWFGQEYFKQRRMWNELQSSVPAAPNSGHTNTGSGVAAAETISSRRLQARAFVANMNQTRLKDC